MSTVDGEAQGRPILAEHEDQVETVSATSTGWLHGLRQLGLVIIAGHPLHAGQVQVAGANTRNGDRRPRSISSDVVAATTNSS